MNLHALISPYIAAINPMQQLSVLISAGNVTTSDGSRTPGYETPGALVASISGKVLTVTAVTAGKLSVGQLLSDAGPTILPGTIITDLGSGNGGPGFYFVNRPQSVASETMTTSLVIPGQVQALSSETLRQASGLNLQGSLCAIYFKGDIEGLVRPLMKGGDLITFPNGSTWLVVIALENWGATDSTDLWSKVAAQLQSAPAPSPTPFPLPDNINLDIPFQYLGSPEAGNPILRYTFVDEFRFLDGMLGCGATAVTPGLTMTIFDMAIDDVNFGTMTFDAGDPVAAFAGSETLIAPGNVLTMIPRTTDDNLALLSGNLLVVPRA